MSQKIIFKTLHQFRSRKAIPLVSVITFFSFLDTNLLIPIIALYAAGLGANAGVIGLIVGLYSITNTPANILSGRLIDKVGYKAPLIIGLVVSAASMFGYSLVRLPAHLALVRAFHGIGGGLDSPATMAAVAEHSSETRRGKAMGAYGMSIAIATLVGFGLSGVIVSRQGYTTLFLVGTIVLAAGAILGLALPGAKKRETAVTNVPPGQWFQNIKALLRRKGLRVSYSGIFAQYFAFGGVVTLLPLYVKGLGMEAFHVGMLLTAFTVMFIILQFPSGAISDRVGRIAPASVGLGLGIASLVMLSSVTTFPLLMVAMALYGTAFGILFPSVSALVPDSTTPRERGTASGLFHGLLTAGVAVGAIAGGWIGELASLEKGLLFSPVMMAVALVIALTALRRK